MFTLSECAAPLSVDRNNPVKKVMQIITYHFGRISAYATIGFIFGLLGKGFFLTGIQQQLSVFIGLAMIIVIVLPQPFFTRYNFSKPLFRVVYIIKMVLGAQFKKKSYSALFSIGLLNGFLPCGMFYLALFGAIAMQSPSLGVAYMMLFGLGTVPLMSSVIYLNALLTVTVLNKIQKTIHYVVIMIGLLFILSGLGLCIPYVSPNSMSLFVQANPNYH